MRMYQKTGWSDFDELRVTDSTLNEGTNSLINERLGAGLMVRCLLSHNEHHKIAMADTQEWRRLFTPLLVY